MSNLKATGEIHLIKDTEQVTETFRKRVVVLKMEDGNYEQFVAFEFTQDKCELLNQYETGQQVTISFNLRGREWNDRHFVNLRAWRIEKLEATQTQAKESEVAKVPDTSQDDSGQDNLPF